MLIRVWIIEAQAGVYENELITFDNTICDGRGLPETFQKLRFTNQFVVEKISYGAIRAVCEFVPHRIPEAVTKTLIGPIFDRQMHVNVLDRLLGNRLWIEPRIVPR